jgi:uncharacterized membrane protein YbhN (UPF0104 family)
MEGEAGRRAKRVLRVVRILLFPAIVAAVFVGVLPRIADLDRVWAAIGSLTSAQYLVLALLAAWNIVTYWPMLVAAMPGLSLAQAAVVCQSSTTVAMTVPGGGALAVGVSYAMYTSWGFRKAQVAMSAFATFVANMSFKLALPVVSLALLAANGDPDAGLVGAAVLGVALMVALIGVVAAMLHREGVARKTGEALGRLASRVRRPAGRDGSRGWGELAVRFRAQTIKLVRDRWLPLLAAEVVSQLSVFVVFLASARFLGISNTEASWAQVLAVFAFVRLATAMPVIPGNVGIAELGYIGGLVLAGAPQTEAVAAVLVFRFLTYFVQIPVGGLTYLVWRRHRGWRRGGPTPVGEDAPEEAPEVGGAEGGQGQPGLVQGRRPGDQEQPYVAAPQ